VTDKNVNTAVGLALIIFTDSLSKPAKNSTSVYSYSKFWDSQIVVQIGNLAMMYLLLSFNCNYCNQVEHGFACIQNYKNNL
jgi:hypothetical protein